MKLNLFSYKVSSGGGLVLNRPWKKVGLLGLPALPALAGCAKTPQSMMDPAGPVAETQLHLLRFDLIAVTIIGVAVVALILYVIFRFRGRQGDNTLPAQVATNRKLEIGLVALVVAILIPLAIEPISATFALETKPNDPNMIHVKVIGHQWWWEFEYTDLGFKTANELVIPAGKKVYLTMTSADVIHSFWAPRLGGKVDVIPGRTTNLWLEGSQTGEFFGQCAELCGTSHANMRFRVMVKPQAEYDAWVATRKTPVKVDALSAEAARGWKVFNDKGCIACHAVDGTNAKGTVGPNLTGVGSRSTIAAGVLENTTEHLQQWLRNPQEVKPRALMPNLGLNQEQLDALTAFLQSLK